MRSLFPTPCAAAGLPDRILCQKCEVRQLAICAALEDEDLHRFDAIVTHIHLDAGETLFSETDEAGLVFTVA